MELTICRAQAEDAPALEELFLKYTQELKQFEMAYELDEGSLPSFIQGRIRSKVAMTAVAKQGDDVVGFLFCSISRMSGYTYGTSPLYGYISDTYVLPQYRRLGAAAQLFNFTRQWLQESEVEYVELKVLESNEKAHMFWQRQGFEPTTRVYGMKI